MKFLQTYKLFENENIFKFNIGDLVRITYNPKVFSNNIYEITNRQTIKGMNKHPDRNQYELKYVYPSKFVEYRDSFVRDDWEDELEKVEDFELDALKYNL